jgi:hypothetical protein
LSLGITLQTSVSRHLSFLFRFHIQ